MQKNLCGAEPETGGVVPALSDGGGVTFPSNGAGTPDYYPLYTALTTFYSDYFVGGLRAHLTTIHTRIFLYFAYLQG